MRIFYLGSFSPHSTESYIAHALRDARHTVAEVEESTTSQLGAISLLRNMGPFDLVLFAKCRFLGEWDQTGAATCEFVAEVRRQGLARSVACWVFDLLNPAYCAERYRWACEVCDVVDRFFTTDGSSIPFLGPTARVLRQGIGHDWRPGEFKPELAADLVFLGTVYGQRKAWVEEMQQKFGRRLWVISDDQGQGIRGERLCDVMASCKLSIAADYPRFDRYWSNRIYQVAGYGGVYVGPAIPGMEEEGWIAGRNYIAISSNQAISEAIIADALEDHAWRANVRAAGSELVRTTMTYLHRVEVFNEGWVK